MHMIKNNLSKLRDFVSYTVPVVAFSTMAKVVSAQPVGQGQTNVQVTSAQVGFTIPTLSEVLGFAIRGFFGIAGLIALYNLLAGAMKWVSSGGDEKKTEGARNQIQAALVGLVIIVVVLAVIVTFEQIVFNQKICVGLSCPLTIPKLLN